jgi:hypothetical protein
MRKHRRGLAGQGVARLGGARQGETRQGFLRIVSCTEVSVTDDANASLWLGAAQ